MIDRIAEKIIELRLDHLYARSPHILTPIAFDLLAEDLISHLAANGYRIIGPMGPTNANQPGWFTTGPRREGGCGKARLDHAGPPYGPQCLLPEGHDDACSYPPKDLT